MIVAVGSLLLSLLFGLGALVLLQPEWLFSTLREQSPQVLYSVETNEKIIALTIDDGPDAVQTAKILDVLKAYDAHATFFLITSRIPGNESLVQRMLDEGHEIANHMVNDEPSILLEPEEFERRLLEAHETLSNFSEARWFRPGSGWYNTEMLKIATDYGYKTALGSIYPYDPQVGSAWVSANYVLWKARPGSIVVLHDFGHRGERTARALSTILPELQSRGYRVVTLSELSTIPEDGR
ncbi:MAG: polysaccharide deacetylase family protein [Anaerolineales bacterium]|nr:polysaccharide deacetylase family protein [Anaerolineales bacterium]